MENKKILFVEDDKIDRMAFERFVRDNELPYDYSMAGSVKEAGALLDDDKFEIVIMDYLLGDGTAFDLFSKVKSAPIVIVTGTGDEEVAVKAMKSGAYDYLIKDADGNYLKTLPLTLENVMARRNSELELAKYRENLELLVKVRTEDLLREIEERKKAEEVVKASLKEKELLLKEIHHRVKNNMQIVSSLINLQARYITDSESLELFKKSENRVRSMALVHENLYELNDLSKIDFDVYIRNLTDHLFYSYDVNQSDISLLINVDDVYLSINEAIPCAQIINELITNSIKYAFPEGNSGEIIISFLKEDDKHRLTISDNGVGIPDDYNDGNSKTLGLQLAEALTSQLKGNIELDNSSGTAFTIVF